jgi:hypothetical protein
LSQTLTFKINKLPHFEIEDFLESWNQIGNHSLLKKGVYKLIGGNNEKSVLSIGPTEIKIDGNIPAEAASIIEKFSSICADTLSRQVTPEVTEVLEGEVIGKNDKPSGPGFNAKFNTNFQAQFQQFQWKNLPWQSKLKVGLFIAIAIPLFIILIPIAIIFMLIRVILFKVFGK